MKLTDFFHSRLTEPYWKAIILTLSAVVILVTVWCLSNGITTVFMHLYYFPIVLLAYRYRWKGFGLATLLAVAYLGLSVIFGAGQGDVILGAFYRALVFVGIAAVIAYLSARLAVEMRAAEVSSELREQYFSLAPAIILVLDRDGRITFLNRKGGEILESSPEDAVGKSWIDTFIPADEREEVRTVFNGLIAGISSRHGMVEGEVITGTGAVRVIRWYDNTLKDAAGKITGTMSYGEDLTEEKKARDTLRQMQQFQENVIANANVWISVLAPDGSTLLVWNDAAEAISGYKKTEVLGKKAIWKKLYPEKDYRRKVTSEIQRIIGQDEFLENFETEIRCADGTPKTIIWNTRGLRDNKGVITGYIAIGRDISAQKAAESRAAESSRFLGTMIDTLPVPIFFKDTSGKYLGCNPPFEEYIGIRRDQLIGKTPYDISPKDLADNYAASDRKIFENPVPQSYETQVQYADGSRHDVIFYKAPFFDKDGSVGGLIGAFLDISERKKVETALRESEEKYRNLFIAMQEGFAYCRMIFDNEGRPVDFIYLTINPAFDRITGVKTVTGKPVTQVFPGIREIYPELFEKYGRVASTGVPESFEIEFKPVGKWLHISVYSTVKGYFVAVFEDITERKRAEELLRQNQLQLATAMDLAMIVNWEYDVPTGEFTFDDRFYTFYGTTAEREGGHRMSAERYAREFVYPEDISSVGGEIQKLLATKDPLYRGQMEHRIIRRDGEIRTIIARYAPVMNEKGIVIRTFGANQDITENKRMEEALRQSEERFRFTVDATNDGIWDWDLPTGSAFFSSRWYTLLGYAPDELPGSFATWRSLVHPDDLEAAEKNIQESIRQKGEGYAIEFRMRTKEGDWKWILSRGKVVEKDAKGNPIRMVGTHTDITERKRAEENLVASEMKFRQFFNNVNDALYLHTMEEQGLPGKFIEVNNVMCERLGYSRDELLLLGPQEIVSDAGRSKMPAIAKVMAGKEKFTFETEHRRKDGSIVPVEVSTVIFSLGGTQVAIASARDITERKRAEEALRDSEEKFREIFNNINDAVHLHEIEPDGRPGRFLDVNEAACRMLGVTRDQLLAHSPLYYTTEYHNPPLEEITRQLRTTGNATFETGHRRADGTIVPVEINAHVTSLMGKTAVLSVIRDLTDRKKAEEEIRLSNVILTTQQETSPDGILIVDEKGKILSYNRSFIRIWGIPQDLIASRKDEPVLQYVTGQCEDPEAFLARVRYLYEHPDEKSHEEIRVKGGRTLERYSAPMTGEDNRYFGRVWYFHDITQRKQAEESVRESRQLFSDIISFLPDPTFVIDNEGNVLAWNRAIEQLSGVPAEDIVGKGNYEYSLWQYGKPRPILIDLVLHPDESAGRVDYSDIRHEGRTVTAHTEISRPGTDKKTILSLVASPLINPAGNVAGAIESIRDITRIKETEAELARINRDLEKIVEERTRALEEEIAQRIHAENDVQDALSYTRSVIEANPDLMVVLDRKGTVLDVNATAESLTGIPRRQLIGTHYFSYLIDDGTHAESFTRLLETGKLQNTIEVRNLDGQVTPLSVNATLIPGRDESDARIIVAAHDITRQKQDEEAIRASLDEKVILLREVHHRVKNNLQIIISLVNLQMRQTKDPLVKQIMAETQNRVRAMSLVHEKLYRSESLSRIDFADYTRFLATQLFSFYGSDTRKVRLDLAMGKIMVDINTAVPLGLLMNELVSNALKHAFPDGREGTITVSGTEDNNLITLVVRDDGIGISGDFDWKNTSSLGMRLVTSLIDQIDGTITLDRDNGTTFTVTVKRDPASGGTG